VGATQSRLTPRGGKEKKGGDSLEGESSRNNSRETLLGGKARIILDDGQTGQGGKFEGGESLGRGKKSLVGGRGTAWGNMSGECEIEQSGK